MRQKPVVQIWRDRVVAINHTHISHYDVECTGVFMRLYDRESPHKSVSAYGFIGGEAAVQNLAHVFGLQKVRSSWRLPLNGVDGFHRVAYDKGNMCRYRDGQYRLFVDSRTATEILTIR